LAGDRLSGRSPGAAILQYVHCGREAFDAVLEGVANQAAQKGVRKHQLFALAKPFEMAADTLGLHRQDTRQELQGQDEGLE
jgi:hypothetical protein